jgi:hypothetical protein
MFQIKIIVESVSQFPWLRPVVYLDPGSGSLITQLIIAGALGALFILTGFWRKLIGKFRNLKTKGKDPDQDADD